MNQEKQEWKVPPPRMNRNFSDPRKTVERREKLTPRETEILDEVTLGYTRQEIGVKLGISEETVKSHRKHILAKLGSRNMSQAVHNAHLKGLLGTNSKSDGSSLSRP